MDDMQGQEGFTGINGLDYEFVVSQDYSIGDQGEIAQSNPTLSPEKFWSTKKVGVGEVHGNVSSAPYERYLSRLEYLQKEAEYEDYELNSDSHDGFRTFVQTMPHLRKGNLVLLENGNLRTIWRDGHGTQLGLQFLGEELIQFVIFKRREHGKPVAQAYGRDYLEGIRRHISAFELESLLYE